MPSDEDRLADWVRPIASVMDRGATDLLAFARAQPADFWEAASTLDGWTRRDVLAHLAGDTGKVSSRAMAAAVSGEPFEDPPDFRDGGDALNALDVAERRGCSIGELLAEIEHERDQWRGLLRRLHAEDEHARWDGFPLTLGQYLRLCATHDSEHLSNIRGPG
jgi:hypothetical protein